MGADGAAVGKIDDITRLKMHREADQDVLDLIRSLMSMSVTLILVGVGIRQSGLLHGGHLDPRTSQWAFPPGADDAQTQTERRFDLADLGPFRYDTPADIDAWIRHLAGIEDQLRLLRAEPGTLTSGDMPEYLFRRTSGVVGLLERLIEDGCSEAIGTGEERLTADLLDGVDISLGNLSRRDPAAGEVPPVPARPRTRAKRKPRNTVFDDRGVPGAGAAG
jgi:hypothetical protein